MRFTAELIAWVLISEAAALAAERQEQRTILAVFDIDMQLPGDLLSVNTREGLNNLLPTLMVENGLLVVPREQMRERLAEIKKDSYRSCHDETCQIELGRELAAQKVLTSRIEKLGEKCQVVLQIIDLEKAVLEKVARVSAECREEPLFDAMREAAAKICGKPVEAGAARSARLNIRSQPSGADAYLEKNLIGKTPLSWETAPGSHTVSLLLKGYEPLQKQISARPEESREILFELKPAFPYATWGHVSFWSGLGIAALGGLAGVFAKTAGDDYKAGDYESFSTSVRWTGAMYGMLSTGVVLMATGVILWVLGKEKTIDDLGTVGAKIDQDDAGVLFVGGRF